MTIEHTSETVAAWLREKPRTTAEPVTVKIGRQTYVGAEYRQERDVTPGCRAYAEGKRTYVLHALYLMGALPPSYVNRSAYAYVTDDGARWFVSGWFTEDDYGPDGIRKGGAVAHVREADGSTRPQTIEDVRRYHYADARVPHFTMAPDDHGVTLPDGVRRTVDRTMRIEIERTA